MALLLPTLALAGYVAAGMRVRGLAAEKAWVEGVMAKAKYKPEMMAYVLDREDAIQIAVIALVVLVLAARAVRGLVRARSDAPKLHYGTSRVLDIRPGATVLEIARAAGIPHASVCGGRGRCSTCRVRVGQGADKLAPPGAQEQKVLRRISAAANLRLACQIRPSAELKVTPLLPATATARDGFEKPGYLGGEERDIAVLFADMRDFTGLAENRLPYDTVFILNLYFEAMGKAVRDAGGRLDKFVGDGVMALFGIDSEASEGCRRALSAARLMAERLDLLNATLADDLARPMRIGVGIHVGPVIVGEMGFEEVMSLTAIGDVVNIASRLEAMTKDLDAQLVVSEDVASRGRVDLGAFAAEEVRVRGRTDPLKVRIIGSASDLAI